MGHSAVLLSVALAILPACVTGAPVQRQHKLLLVSFDGFRWNYDQDVDTPNLDSMAQEGVKAQYMTPAFVTMTSPCHFTLVTGECQPQDGAWGWKGPKTSGGRGEASWSRVRGHCSEETLQVGSRTQTRARCPLLVAPGQGLFPPLSQGTVCHRASW